MIRGMSTPTMTRVPCSKVYRATDKRVMPVDLAVVHWTASPPRSAAAPDEMRMRAWLGDETRKSSTHFIALRDGRILQAADISERTWHAGGAKWVHPNRGPVVAINCRSIGIDVENVGFVTERPDGFFEDYYGSRYRGLPPMRAAGRFYEPLTCAQAASVLALAKWLAESLPVLRDPARWVGHSDIQPGKSDPGPLFPWSSLRDVVATAGGV